MLSITTDNCNEIRDKQFKNTVNVIYGAGITGKRMYKLLDELGFQIKAFVDDDYNKHGTLLNGIMVWSYEELKNVSAKMPINVVVASIYGNMLFDKLDKLSVKTWEMFSIYQMKYRDSLEQNLSLNMSKKTWLDKLGQVYTVCLDDEQSKNILDTFRYAVTKDEYSFDAVSKIASKEEHYFVESIRNAIKGKITIIDAGAYTGDMLWQLKNNNIKLNKMYAFEANPSIYDQLKENISNLQFEDKVEALNYALWDSVGILHFSVADDENTAGRVVSGGGIDVHSTTIDSHVDQLVDFVKMDIEGAEMHALRGGEDLLVRSRPLLAISIYHSFDDMVNIPLYLNRILKNYKFFIRHHSLIFSETVLYGIPLEKYAV